MVANIARVIGEASIRLTIDGTTLGPAINRAFKAAAKEANGAGLFDGIDKDSDRVSKNVEGRFSRALGNVGKLGKTAAGGLTSLVTAGSKIAGIGLAAGTAIAGVGSLISTVAGLATVLGQAAGAAALLPAAFAAFKIVSATVTLGVQNMSDAFKALASGDTAALDAALKKLAPSARQVVQAAQSLKPAFDSLQLQVQQNLFAGLGTTVQQLGQRYMPVLRSGLAGVATELNGAAKGLLDFANNGEVAGQVSLLFGDVTKTVHNLSPSLANIASALLDIGQVGATFLPGLANGFTSVTEQFSNFIREAAASGQLATFIQNALDVLNQLGQIAQNVGAIIGNVFSAASAAGGGGLLDTILQVTDAFRQFTESAAGAQQIGNIFAVIHAAVSAILPVFTGLVGIIGGQVAPVLLQLVTTIGPVLQQILTPLGLAINAALPGLTALGNGFASLLAGIAPALPAVGQLAAVLGQGLGQVLSTLGPVIGQLATVLAGTLAQAIPPLVPIITQLVTILGQVLTAVAPLIAPIIQLVAAALTPILAIIQALIPPFTTLINSVLKAIQPIIPVIAQAFSQLGTALAPLAGALGEALVSIFTALLPIVQPLIGVVVQLVQAFVPLIPPITTVIKILGQIISVVASVLATIIGFIASALQPLIAAFGVVTSAVGGALNFVLNIISNVIGVVSGIFTNFLGTVSSVWNSITSFISGAINKIGSFISNGFNSAVNFVRNAFNNIVNAISNGISSAVNFVKGLPGKILSALKNFGSLLFNAGRDLLQGLINGITSMVKNIINKVISVGKSILGGIKSALGISSPSKEMAKIGVFVGQGLIKGMDSMQGAVSNAAGDLGNSALSGATGPIRELAVPSTGNVVTSAGGGAAGGTLVQNNYMLPGTDVNQFANTVLARADADLASNASTFSVGRQPVQLGVNDNFLAGVGM